MKAAGRQGYVGLDLVAEAQAGGSGHDLNIISGATVTVMVIDDSIVRSGCRWRARLGLGGLAAPAADAGPRFEINPDADRPGRLGNTLLGDGTIRGCR
jgi:NosR/NirI family nitrous oxide reductase transcriptional regulator